jgi:hypothetical protein
VVQVVVEDFLQVLQQLAVVELSMLDLEQHKW